MTLAVEGLVAATLTPFGKDGQVNYSAIPGLVSSLKSSGINGLYVCGSTGEGVSLTREERCQVAEAYVTAANKQQFVFIQVGHNSIEES
ncbi:MAG: dihydrodipicolinate synthase family protein, partial [Planctomycetota bacterium]